MTSTAILLCGHPKKEQLAARLRAALHAYRYSNQTTCVCYFSSDTWNGEWNGYWVRDYLVNQGIPPYAIFSEPLARHTVAEVRGLLDTMYHSDCYVIATSWYHIPRVRFWCRQVMERRGVKAEIRSAPAYGGEELRHYARELRSWGTVLRHRAEQFEVN